MGVSFYRIDEEGENAAQIQHVCEYVECGNQLCRLCSYGNAFILFDANLSIRST